jgi:hypothetical protein
MKKSVLFLLSLLTGQFGFTQDWQLFIKNQVSYYQQYIDNSIKVESFLFDSSIYNNGIKYLYFNSKSELSDYCYSNLRQEINKLDWLKNPNKIDSLIIINDSVLFVSDYYSEMDTFIFKPFSNVGDSWITNGITLKCTEKKIAEIVGIQDSIKVFECNSSPYDTIIIVLSKSFGLIKFLPFKDFLYHSGNTAFSPYFELIGLKKENISKGYVQPDFNEYFHLNVGDVLFWRDYSDPDDIRIPESTTYHVDSITFVYISKDSVYYEYKITDYDERGAISYIGNYSSFYLRMDEGKIFRNSTSWFGLKYDRFQSNEVFILNELDLKIEGGDTITYIYYQLPGIFIDTTDCQIRFAYDYDLTVGFSTREGKRYQGTFSWGESSTVMIGSIINGVKYGITDIPTGLNGLTTDGIKIYPIPAIDNLTINSPNTKIVKLELYDISGNLILSKSYTEKLNLREVNSGIYILRLVDKNNILHHFEIIKQ